MKSFTSAMVRPNAESDSKGVKEDRIIKTPKNNSQIQALKTPEIIDFATRNKYKTELIGNEYAKPSIAMFDADGKMAKNKLFKFENMFDVSSAALNYLNNYKFVFTKSAKETLAMHEGTPFDPNDDQDIKDPDKKAFFYTPMTLVPSLFNPYLGVHAIGISGNIPIQNTMLDVNKDKAPVDSINQDQTIPSEQITSYKKDLTDCRTSTLCELSKFIKQGEHYYCPMGMERYKLADFIYCKDAGKISNNYMITLRKFSHAVGDNISNQIMRKNRGGGYDPQLSPDIGRMICWIGEDNKLEDILKYNFGASWKKMEAKDEVKSGSTQEGEGGLLGSIINMGNPSYLKKFAAGTVGSQNQILQGIAGKAPSIFSANGRYEGSEALGHYDEHIIYTPKDTIWETHKYEGKLSFNQEFSLVFRYELRAYENINPRTALMDLLGNILAVTYRRGHFWGGSHTVLGGSGSNDAWGKANALIDGTIDKLGGFTERLLHGDVSEAEIMGSLSNAFGALGDIFNSVVDGAKEIFNSATGKGTMSEGTSNKVHNVIEGAKNVTKGMLKNKFGRPGLYGFMSILSGDNVGPWHVTIGNPRMPILSIGNLILEDTEIQHYGPLGIDDFPTGLKVTVKLKHAMPRDSMKIEHMYTNGSSALVMPISGDMDIYQYLNSGAKTTTKPIQDYEGKTRNVREFDPSSSDVNMNAIANVFGTTYYQQIYTGNANNVKNEQTYAKPKKKNK